MKFFAQLHLYSTTVAFKNCVLYAEKRHFYEGSLVQNQEQEKQFFSVIFSRSWHTQKHEAG